MKTRFKRFASVVCAATMALSLAVPAFADTTISDTAKTATFTYAANYQGATVKVVVSANGKVYTNPLSLALPAELDGSTDKVASTIGTIQNMSNVPIGIVVNPYVSKKGNANFELATTSNTGGSVDASTNPTGAIDTPVSGKKTISAVFQMVDIGTATSATASNFEEPDFATLLTGTTKPTTSLDTEIVLPAGDGSSTVGGVAAFRVTGDAVNDSTTDWIKTDTVTTTVIFSFLQQTADDSGSGDDEEPTVSTPVVTLGETDLSMSSGDGDSTNVQVTVDGTDLTSGYTGTISYVIDDESVCSAQVLTSGKVKISALAAGSAIVTITYTATDGGSGSATVNVTCS